MSKIYDDEPGTTVPVTKVDGSTKEMSLRQLKAALRPGDVVAGIVGGGSSVPIKRRVVVEAREREGVRGRMQSGRTLLIRWGEIDGAKLRHPSERGSSERNPWPEKVEAVAVPVELVEDVLEYLGNLEAAGAEDVRAIREDLESVLGGRSA